MNTVPLPAQGGDSSAFDLWSDWGWKSPQKSIISLIFSPVCMVRKVLQVFLYQAVC